MMPYMVAVVCFAAISAAYAVHRDLHAEREAKAGREWTRQEREWRAAEAKQIPAMTAEEVHRALAVVEQMRVVVNTIAFNSGLTGVGLPLPTGAEEAVPKR
jgi:hypothetical protein